MAPNLATAQHQLIKDMILSKSLKCPQIADTAHCSIRSIKHHRANLHDFGSTTAPRNGGGRPRVLTEPMIDTLRGRLLEKPDLYLDELVVFLSDEFNVLTTTSTVS
jgi:transposase